MDSLGIEAVEPSPVWDRPIEVNSRELFKSVAKVLVDGAIGKWDDALKDASDAIAALGLMKSPGEVAWVLVQRAGLKAVLELTSDCRELFPQHAQLASVSAEIDAKLSDVKFIIEPSFFDNPTKNAFVDELGSLFTCWLERMGIQQYQAHAVARRLPSYFVFALHNEWRSRPSEYSIVQLSLDSPFSRATAKEVGWIQYRSWLQKQVNQRMFDELFSLQQIFVAPRAYFEYKQGQRGREFGSQVEQPTRKVVDLRNELSTWLYCDDHRHALRIISGGPGSGKSSFAKMFASHIATQNSIPVVFIPLHRFEHSGDLFDGVEAFVKLEGFLSENPLDPKTGERRILLIFDGLDELSMQGKLGAEVAQSFLREVDRKLGQFNGSGSVRVLALVIGRELVIQANLRELRTEGQVLHILPYFIDPLYRSEANWEDSGSLLSVDQRNEWWKLYGQASGLGYDRLPPELSRQELVDVTSQPLLNYLIALGYARKRLDFSKKFNLNLMYEDLLQSVYERGWAGHQHAAIRSLTCSDFVRILEEVALCSWHGTGRTTTVGDISQRCGSAGLGRMLEGFQEGAKAGVTRLLTAFYFRQVAQRADGEQTFEFTHKSFGEYLTARRLMRGLDKVKIINRAVCGLAPRSG